MTAMLEIIALGPTRFGDRLSADEFSQHRQHEECCAATQCQPAEPRVQKEDLLRKRSVPKEL
ncbi:hypothetical protein [Pararhizobium sp. LjRoot238]|uniref:hypothetical protein n=1 Tax=Pararhizobium sp. LjRoot238 TaxID=3342293 RepID=UPI003ECD3792